MDDGVLFRGGPIYTGQGVITQGWVLCHAGTIIEMGEGRPDPQDALARRTVDLDGRALVPGLIDLHAHGAMGCDTMDADPASLRTMAAFYARHGVTGFLAATMTASQGDIEAALAAITTVRREGTGAARLIGAHLEGPYLDPEHAGAQARELLRPAVRAEYERVLAGDVVRIITLAPEHPQNLALARYARANGVVVSMGHTGAGYEVACAAIDAGVSHASHLYNAMPPLQHRQPGAVAAALLQPGITCELIADLIHVHAAVLDLSWRLLGPERTVLVTDAMAGTGMPDGEYALGPQMVRVEQGVARTAEGALAGSTLTMERALRNMMAATAQPLEAVLPAITRVPARELGLQAGQIATGLAADLVVLDEQGDVDLTLVAGSIVWER